MDKVPEAIAQEAARQAVAKALRHIENAQNELGSACAELSRLCHGVPVWRACHKLTDRVHAFWYRVNRFRAGGKYFLDSTNLEALRKLLTEREEKTGG